MDYYFQQVMAHVRQLTLQSKDNDLNQYIINNLMSSISTLQSRVMQMEKELEQLKEHGLNPVPNEEERTLARTNIIEAIKAFRRRTGVSLKQSKDIMEPYRG